MRHILLIGGAGYIGSVLTNHLLNAGYKVRSLDLLIYGNNLSVLPYLNHDGYEFVYGDFCEEKTLSNALKDISDVVLLAGLVGDPITKKYPKASKAINEIGILNSIDKMNHLGLNRVIFTSTCSNYGLIDDSEIADEDFELKPLSLYAKSKVTCEKKILSLKNKIDFSPTILRFATAFGLSSRMRFDLTISQFTKDLALGKELLVYDANTWRPYCHVQDFSRLIIKVLNAPTKKIAFEVFNAGSDINNASKKMIVNYILSSFPKGKIIYQENGNDPRNYRVNFKKVNSVLGFEPKYNIEDGISELKNAINNKVFDLSDRSTISFGNYKINYKIP